MSGAAKRLERRRDRLRQRETLQSWATEVDVTSAEWAACEHPGPMLEFLRGRTSDRKLRLFACACCRSILGFIPTGACRDAVEVSLRYADDQATADALAAARSAAIAAADRAGPGAAAAWAACEAANPSALQAARAASEEAREQIRRQSPPAAEEEARAQAGFLRDIIGSPFREVGAASVRRLGRHPVIREIAESVYDGGPQEDMRLLADELERTGCASPAVLDHCRSEEPHVRGCWIIDLLLSADAGPSQPNAPAARAATDRVQELRDAFAEYLGPKKYRRFLRLAVGSAFWPGRVGRPEAWDEFVLLHPEYGVSNDELAEVFAVCAVHGCELVERTVFGADDPALVRDPAFLQARGTRFPYSHGENTGTDRERHIWWCPECQQAREEWMAGRA